MSPKQTATNQLLDLQFIHSNKVPAFKNAHEQSFSFGLTTVKYNSNTV